LDEFYMVRVAAVLRLLDHPAVEGQPAQFPVDEALRRGGIEGQVLPLMRQRDHVVGRHGGDILVGNGEVRIGAGGRHVLTYPQTVNL
jgi:polyphosphate kinase